MFGSNNQNPAPVNNPLPTNSAVDTTSPATPANPDGLSSFTMDLPNGEAGTPHKDASAPLLPEPSASPVTDATSAPHVDQTPAVPTPSADPLTDLPAPTPPAPTSTLADLEASVHGDNTAEGDAPEPGPSPVHSELLDIKTQALNQLSPLISHLDQSPEDKFKTLMMMIQANDNQNLVKEAYEAAQQITDEKAKSQALLDIVNEINYFTQKNK